MTRPSLFEAPFLLGFEHTREAIERAARAGGEGYPPYNVEALADGRVRISIAVAGFSAEQLEITLEGRQLDVTGKREAPEAERAFVHRGIAARSFVRSFILEGGLEVQAARLEHGLLHIDLVRPAAERATRRIPIHTGP